MAELATFSATVHGRVQGVNFRYYVERYADALGLKGYVKNLPDRGMVEVYAEGEKEKLDELYDTCLYRTLKLRKEELQHLKEVILRIEEDIKILEEDITNGN